MKISTILDFIDSGQMALPEFQRGYVWNREQVRGLFHSLYQRHPVGGLLVWTTESEGATHRGDNPLAAGVVKLLLDGQQRMTSLYGVIRGRAPEFFDGSIRNFSGLRFHLGEESFEFYQPVKMRDDPLWIDVTHLMKEGNDGLGTLVTKIGATPEHSQKIGAYAGRLARLLGIKEIDLHVEDVTGADKTLDVIVDIFNRVNSGGTKLSKGDLALAKICAEWPEARNKMKAKLREWQEKGYDFTLDWLLRSVNTVLTGEAKFSFLHDQSAVDIQDGLKRATTHLDACLNMIAGRLGLDHDRVLFGRFALPVMVRYRDRKHGSLSERERDRLLFWFVQAGMWGRFSGSTETYIDRDLAVLEDSENNLETLLDELRLWNGSLRVKPGHFDSWSLGSRFYPILYMLTRMGGARDWCNGLKLEKNTLGKMNQLELHHIFPKAKLYGYEKQQYNRSEVNALANFCFLTKECNLKIGDKLPEVYFSEIEKEHPGALASQWIPLDRDLWKIENYLAFLEARRQLLAAETNLRFEELLHEDTSLLVASVAAPAPLSATAPTGEARESIGGIATDSEEAEIEAINDWVERQGLPRGQVTYELSDEATGRQRAILDLAWPNGLQPGLTSPLAVLLNEPPEVLEAANAAGFRCFTARSDFHSHVNVDVLGSGG